MVTITASKAEQPESAPEQERIRALISLLLSSDLVRHRAIPLNHAPESLSRSPAKLEILVHSLLVFIERGVAPVTVQDLLDASAVSRRTFYKYFRNKIDVLESLYKLAVDIMVLRYKADIGRALSVEEAAFHLVDAFFGYHKDLAPVIRLMQEEAVRMESPLSPHRIAAIAKLVELVNEEMVRVSGRKMDGLMVKSLIWAMESASIECLRSDNTPGMEIDHARSVMQRIVAAAMKRELAG